MEKSFHISTLLVTFSLSFFIPVSLSVPFILFHGIQDQCSNGEVSSLTELLSNLSSSPGSCLEIGNGDQDSVYMPLTQQANVACEKVKQIKELSQGYNIVALSQGNLVARGLIEFCDNAPPVFNYVSLGGPHAGISDIRNCTSRLCKLLETEVYTDYVQDHIAPSGYIKIPTDIKDYLKHSKYLPKLNNEKSNKRNPIFKNRFTSLHNLVLVMFQGDTVMTPKESSWFGYYPDGTATPLLSPQQTKLYIEDWIGLKTLDVSGKVKFVSVPGEHLKMAHDDIVKYIVPYLQNQPRLASECKLNRKIINKGDGKQDDFSIHTQQVYRNNVQILIHSNPQFIADRKKRIRFHCIEDAPPVFNYVSLGRPHAGISDIPKCNYSVCKLLKTQVYTDYVQTNLYAEDWISLKTLDVAG